MSVAACFVHHATRCRLCISKLLSNRQSVCYRQLSLRRANWLRIGLCRLYAISGHFLKRRTKHCRFLHLYSRAISWRRNASGHDFGLYKHKCRLPNVLQYSNAFLPRNIRRYGCRLPQVIRLRKAQKMAVIIARDNSHFLFITANAGFIYRKSVVHRFKLAMLSETRSLVSGLIFTTTKVV